MMIASAILIFCTHSNFVMGDGLHSVPINAQIVFETDHNWFTTNEYYVNLKVNQEAGRPVRGHWTIKAYGDIKGGDGTASKVISKNISMSKNRMFDSGQADSFTSTFYIDNPQFKKDNVDIALAKKNLNMWFDVGFDVSDDNNFADSAYRLTFRNDQLTSTDLLAYSLIRNASAFWIIAGVLGWGIVLASILRQTVGRILPQRFWKWGWSIPKLVLSVICILFSFAAYETNPSESAHRNQYFNRKPLEALGIKFDETIGVVSFRYDSYLFLSILSLKFTSDFPAVPFSYGFFGEVYLYDDPRLKAIADSIQKSR